MSNILTCLCTALCVIIWSFVSSYFYCTLPHTGLGSCRVALSISWPDGVNGELNQAWISLDLVLCMLVVSVNYCLSFVRCHVRGCVIFGLLVPVKWLAECIISKMSYTVSSEMFNHTVPLPVAAHCCSCCSAASHSYLSVCLCVGVISQVSIHLSGQNLKH